MRKALCAKRRATLGGPDMELTASSLGHGFHPWHPALKVGCANSILGTLLVQPTLGGLPLRAIIVNILFEVCLKLLFEKTVRSSS